MAQVQAGFEPFWDLLIRPLWHDRQFRSEWKIFCGKFA